MSKIFLFECTHCMKRFWFASRFNTPICNRCEFGSLELMGEVKEEGDDDIL